MTYRTVSGSAEINQALFQVTHGLYIVTARSEDRINGQCLDALMQVTNVPPRIAIGIGRRSLTHEMVMASDRFAVSVLDQENPDSASLIRRFGFQSGRDADKFADLAHEATAEGLPILSDAVAVYECTVLPEMTVDLGTHTLFVASVDRAGVREGGVPLTYNEYRRSIRKE